MQELSSRIPTITQQELVNPNLLPFQEKMKEAIKVGIFWIEMTEEMQRLESHTYALANTWHKEKKYTELKLEGFNGYHDRENCQIESLYLDQTVREHLTPPVQEMSRHMESLALNLLQIALRTAGVAETVWSEGCGGLFEGLGQHHFAYNHYREERQGQIGLPAHKDYGMLTLVGLSQKGLEAELEAGTWTAVEPKPQHLLVNLGRAFEILVNDPEVANGINHRVTQLAMDRVSYTLTLDGSFDKAVYKLDNGELKEVYPSYDQYIKKSFDQTYAQEENSALPATAPLQAVNMPTVTPPRCKDLTLSRVGFGALQLSFMEDREKAKNLVVEAWRQGVNLFDTAALYGPEPHSNEKLLGEGLQAIRAIDPEAKLYVNTKCGISFTTGYEASPEAIRASVERSFEALGVEQINILYLHRTDPNATEEEFYQTLAVLKEYVDAGRVTYLGLSETSTKFIEMANRFFEQNSPGRNPLAFIQSAYSIATRRAEQNGVMEACKKHGIQFVSYTSVVRGLVDPIVKQSFTVEEIDRSTPEELLDTLDNLLGLGPFVRRVGFFAPDVLKKNLKIILSFQELASQLGFEPSQLALAWVQSKGVIPIPGTTSMEHLNENLQSAKITLTEQHVQELDRLFQDFEGNPNPVDDFLDDHSL